MDRADLGSYLSEDGTSSNISCASGLTGFEDEISEIRNLIELSNQQSSKPSKDKQSPRHHTESFSYETRISNLNSELQNVLKLNEKYKNDLFNLQRQQDLQSHEKFEKLLRRSTWLEVQLQNANAHIEGLRRSKKFVEAPELKSRLFQLENKNYELETRVASLLTDAESASNDIKSLQNIVHSLNNQLTSAREDINIKRNCVEELKKKIAEQHYDLQEQKRKDTRTENDLTSLKNELQSTVQSVLWYKQRLEDCRRERSKVTEELLCQKTEINEKDSKIEALKTDIADWKHKHRELSMVREREKNRFNETVEKLKNEANAVLPLREDEDIFSEKNLYEKEITDLTNEMLKLKTTIVEHGLTYDRITKENAELLSRNTTLQKSHIDKELRLQILESAKMDLSDRFNEVNVTLAHKENELLILKAQSGKLKSSLDSALCEKEEIAQVAVHIRSDFQRFLGLHNRMKQELEEMTRTMLELQKGKQEIFMQHNWNVCELEEFKHKETEYLKKIGILSHEKLQLTRESTMITDESSELKKQVDELLAENGKLHSQNKEFCVKLGFLTKEVERLKVLVEDCEHKISFYKNSINGLNNDMKSSGERCVKIEDEKDHYRITFSNILEYLCQKFAGLIQNDTFDIKSIKDVYGNNNLNIKDAPFHEVLNRLDNYLLQMNNYVNIRRELKENLEVKVASISKLKLFEKLKAVEKRTDTLSRKFVDTETVLHKLQICSTNPDVLNLRAAVKVKDLEMQEKQKRYEVNNRTLLRKIKEHMRGRNTAEKHLKYLEVLYGETAESLNDVKLELNEKVFELDSCRESIETKDRTIEKLQNAVVNLEIRRECSGCTEINALRCTVNEMEAKLLTANNNIDVYIGDVRSKEMSITALKKQLSEMHGKVENLLMEHARCSDTCRDLTEEVNSERNKYKKSQCELHDVNLKLERLASDCSDLRSEKTKHVNDVNAMRNEVGELKEQLEFYVKEIEVLNCSLHQKDEEIDSLRSQKMKTESDNSRKECRLQDLLVKSEQDVKDMQDSLKLVTGEKYFLQRLSNDLKIALNITNKQNQVLREKLGSQPRDTEYHSLPEFVSNIPSPSTFDDARINRLLKITNNPDKCKPLTNLHDCLNSLKREMAVLQKQIAEKKYAASSL